MLAESGCEDVFLEIESLGAYLGSTPCYLSDRVAVLDVEIAACSTASPNENERLTLEITVNRDATSVRLRILGLLDAVDDERTAAAIFVRVARATSNDPSWDPLGVSPRDGRAAAVGTSAPGELAECAVSLISWTEESIGRLRELARKATGRRASL